MLNGVRTRPRGRAPSQHTWSAKLGAWVHESTGAIREPPSVAAGGVQGKAKAANKATIIDTQFVPGERAVVLAEHSAHTFRYTISTGGGLVEHLNVMRSGTAAEWRELHAVDSSLLSGLAIKQEVIEDFVKLHHVACVLFKLSPCPHFRHAIHLGSVSASV